VNCFDLSCFFFFFFFFFFLFGRSKNKTFESILRKLNAVESRSCGKCNSAMHVQRILLKPWPKVFALSVAWSDSDPPMDEVTQLLSAIDLEIDLAKVFFDDGSRGKRYKIRGLICYYLKHYAAYFFSDKENAWISFDDVSVQEVGPTWKDVMRKSRMGHQKPVLIFFEEVSHSSDVTDSPTVVVRHRSAREKMANFLFKTSNEYP
jgi:hypothetical protein